MKHYINEIIQAYVILLKKMSSLRFVFTIFVMMLLTNALMKGLITGSEYINAILIVSGIFLGVRTITHFGRKDEKGESN